MTTVNLVPQRVHPFPSMDYTPALIRFSFSYVAFNRLPVRARLLCTSSNNVDYLPHSSCDSLLHLYCDHVPHDVLQRASEAGFVEPTVIQRDALPILLSGRDCVLHSQTGSGKTLAYLLSVFSVLNPQNPALQALIVVPSRGLGFQVVRVARTLASKKCTVMALLDGASLKRQKISLKANPPAVIIATLGCLSEMIEARIFTLHSLQVLVVDEVDFIFNSSKQAASLRNLLGFHSSCNNRQTILVSASIPQHKRFLHDCVQHKWTKRDVVHIHRNSSRPMPPFLSHRFAVCNKNEKNQTLLSLLLSDKPTLGFVFLNEQSEKSKRAGDVPQTQIMMEFLKASYGDKVALLGDEVGANKRAASLSVCSRCTMKFERRQHVLVQESRVAGFLFVATGDASRGVDVPNTSHVYNFELPDTAVGYLHRAGRSGRKPLSQQKCFVTSVICAEERFVLQRFENELVFRCEEIKL